MTFSFLYCGVFGDFFSHLVRMGKNIKVCEYNITIYSVWWSFKMETFGTVFLLMNFPLILFYINNGE